MTSARGMVRVGVALAAALAVVAGSAFAEEFFGHVTKVDPESRKITVVEKKTGEEKVLKVADDAVIVTPKKPEGFKADLKKMETHVAEAKKRNAEFKGIPAKITYEGETVSKIEPQFAKKKAEAGAE